MIVEKRKGGNRGIHALIEGERGKGEKGGKVLPL